MRTVKEFARILIGFSVLLLVCGFFVQMTMNEALGLVMVLTGGAGVPLFSLVYISEDGG